MTPALLATWPRQPAGARSAGGQEPYDRCGERGGDHLLNAGPYEQRGVGCIVHIAALDQDLGHGGEVQAGQVVAADVAVITVVIADWHLRVAEHRRVNIAAEPDRR